VQRVFLGRHHGRGTFGATKKATPISRPRRHKSLFQLLTLAQPVQSIMGATEMRRSKLFIFLELKRATGPVTDWTDALGLKVDIVIEDPRGHVVGIEVKAAATVTATDFSGLRKLAEACGKRFILGLVLYDHDTTVPFGERSFALPISTLWK
jgi:predicted AAA+ superfamily ATPase